MSSSHQPYLTASIDVGVEDTQDVLELRGDDQRLAKRTGQKQRPAHHHHHEHTPYTKLKANRTAIGKQLVIGW